MNAHERFWARVDTSGDCWIWRGSIKKKDGYGRYAPGGTFGRRSVMAHHYSLLHQGIGISSGMVVHHTCRNKTCVRPEHLTVMTREAHARLHNVAGTHCRRGHPFDDGNSYYVITNGQSRRLCRRCNAMAQARRKLRLHGPSAPWPLLSAESIPVIRDLAAKGMKQRDIGAIFGVTQPCISDVLRGRNWRGVGQNGSKQ